MSRYKNYNGMSVVLIVIIIATLLTSCLDSNTVDKPILLENSPTVSDPVPEEPIENVLPVSIPYNGDLELPVIGATGYTSVNLELKAYASAESDTVELLEAGTAFTIVKEEGDWWFIERGPASGWLQHNYCFINLPDVIPSIIYDNTNTYSSKYISSGKSIPGITNQALYSGRTYNERLEREEYIMPVLYSMSKKIYKAQQMALSEGNTLKIYEAYRPNSVQNAVKEGMTELANNDPEVMVGINTPPWGMSWFIAKDVSNHQRGYAIDVSLVKINTKKETSIGNYSSMIITDYTEYTMPTQIHELSRASVVFTTTVLINSTTAWKDAIYADSMNEAAITLQTYCTDAGLTPLASEWWHFNDIDAMNATADNRSDGDYILTEIYSANLIDSADEGN